MIRVKRYLIFFLLILLYCQTNTFPCTVIYVSNGILFLAGNNEDWSDPNTKFFIIPSDEGKYGWIKFGFAGGYPQGGMNEHGLFWDATASPYLDIPYSEANKEKYNGPLMQKVIEECKSLDEALEIFAHYYCEDQYRAQYLIGDASGKSAIIEGDSIILKSGEYQVLTNFYHSAPQLGGYPCWRYDTACSMLQDNNELSLVSIGKILAATHQEGSYPTQYSNIYDLKDKVIYLFHYHNFDELVKINLQSHLSNPMSLDISRLYSKLQIISPGFDDIVESETVTFRWKGLSSSHYVLHYSTDPEFNSYKSASVKNLKEEDRSMFYFSTLFAFILIVSGLRLKPKIKRVAFIVLFVVSLSGCENTVSPQEPSEVKEFSYTVNNLESNSVYYWKIQVTSSRESKFSSESIVYSFKTKDN